MVEVVLVDPGLRIRFPAGEVGGSEREEAAGDKVDDLDGKVVGEGGVWVELVRRVGDPVGEGEFEDEEGVDEVFRRGGG